MMFYVSLGLSTERRGEEDTVAYMSQFDHVDIGITFPPYEDPPPPYSSPKPPRILPGEAPPPYTEHAPDEDDHTNEGNVPTAAANNLSLESTPGSLSPTGQGSTPTLQSALNNSNSVPYSNRNSESIISRENSLISDTPTSPHGTVLSSDDAISPSSTDRLADGDQCMSVELSPDVGASRSPEKVNSLGRLSIQSPFLSHLLNSSGKSRPLSDCYCASISEQNRTDALLVPTPQQIGAPVTLFPSNKINMSQSQYIKRSGSVEIRRGSSSPRNSYSSLEADHGGRNGCDVDRGRSHSSPLRPDSLDPDNTRDYSLNNPHFTASDQQAVWLRNKTSTPKSSPGAGMSVPTEQNHNKSSKQTVRGQDWSRDKQMGHGSDMTCDKRPSRSSDMTCDKRPSRGGDMLCCLNGQCGDAGGSREREARPALKPLNLKHSNSQLLQGMAAGGDSGVSAPREERSPPSPGVYSPTTSSSSPRSPPFLNILRSGSVVSQISQFSVCSETGEQRRPGALSLMNETGELRRPRTALSNTQPAELRTSRTSSNNVQYPMMSTGKSKGISPSKKLQPTSTGHAKSKHCVERNESACQSVAAALPLLEPVTMPGGGVKPSTSVSQLVAERVNQASRSPDARTYRKVIYRDPDEIYDSKLEAAKPEPTTRSIGISCQQDLGTNKVPLRNGKQKKKKQRPQSTPGKVKSEEKVEDADQYENENMKQKRRSMESPERLRRLARGWDEKARIKEYGFIDDPTLLKENCPDGLNLRDVRTTPGSSPSSRSNSKERKRDGSGERQRMKLEGTDERREGSTERRKVKREGSANKNRVKQDHLPQDRSTERHDLLSKRDSEREIGNFKDEKSKGESSCGRRRSKYRGSTEGLRDRPNKVSEEQRDKRIVSDVTCDNVCQFSSGWDNGRNVDRDSSDSGDGAPCNRWSRSPNRRQKRTSTEFPDQRQTSRTQNNTELYDQENNNTRNCANV